MMEKKSLTVLLLVLFYSVCGINNVIGQERVGLRYSAEWSYSKSAAGLRQNGQPVPATLYLIYKSKRDVPENIKKEGVRITTDIGTFRYSERKNFSQNLSEADGWLYTSAGWIVINETKNQDASYSQQKISPEELKVGFYEAPFNQKKKNTPSSWVFIEINGISEPLYWIKEHFMFWVDPEKLDHLPLG